MYIPSPASLSEVSPVLFWFQQQTHTCPYLHHSLSLLFAVKQNVVSPVRLQYLSDTLIPKNKDYARTDTAKKKVVNLKLFSMS